MKSKRFYLLDSIRGFMIINMIVYHAVWDMVYIFDISMPWFESDMAYIWQQNSWIFFILSGFCWSMGSKKLKRALQVIGASIIISVITTIFMPENVVLFGVLSAIGTCMLVMIPLDKVFRKINPYAGLIVCFGLFIITRNINSGTLGFEEWKILSLPKAWYANYFTAYLGFPPVDFSSSDYFSVFPWLFLYQTGYFLYGIFKNREWLKYLTFPRIKPLEWVGRNSLMIYMIHQPVVYAVLYLVC